MTALRALVTTIATFALLPGCHVDQAAEVSVYREQLDLTPTTRTSGEPLTLREALRLTNQNNENLAAQGEQFLRAAIARRRTVANFLPTVDLVGSQRLREQAGSSDNGSSDNATLDITAELELNVFNGFRDVNRYWRDTYLIEQRRREMLSFQEQLLLDVSRIFFEILRSEASVRVLENSLAVQEERLRFTRGQQQAGRARPLDVAQTEAQVSATRTFLIDARRDVRNAREILALLTGADVRDAVMLDQFEVPEQIAPVEAHLVAAEQYRDDLLAADAAVKAARREVEVAFGQYYPTVSLNLTGFLYRESAPDEIDWDALLTASIPIFSAGRIHADVREAWSFARQAVFLRSYVRRQVVDQIRRAYHDLAASTARLAELRVRLAAAEQAFEQAEESYRVGLATNLDRVVAQDALLDAQLQFSSEEFNRKVFFLTLLQAAGLLREELESSDAAARLEASAMNPATQPAPER